LGGRESERDARVAREPETSGGERRRTGYAGDGEPEQRPGRECLDDRHAARGTTRHWSLTLPRWFTTTLRDRVPAISVTVPFSAVPSAPKTMRLRAGSPANRMPRGKAWTSSVPLPSRSS